MMAERIDWPAPAAQPELGARQVHIWRTSLDVSADTYTAYRQLLASDELERAQRFVFEHDRRRYVVARGVLRRLLAAYLTVAASDLVFGYEAYGKPFLARPHNATLFFNLSHSADLAVYGFSRQGHIGIDIECHRVLADLHQLAATVFSAGELAALRGLPAHQQQTAFYAGWTRKEAFIKAIGQGLSFPLDRFDVSLTPGEPPRILRVHDDPAAAQRWHITAFSPSSDCSGAMVVEGQEIAVRFYQAVAGLVAGA